MLASYLDRINEIQGWCIPELWNCIQPIHNFQLEKGLDGPIAEIGVYHGKFFTGLALTKGDKYTHCAMDVFDMQEFNLDGAGEGNLEIFKRTLDRFKVSNYECHTVDSMQMEQSFIDERRNKYALFSVDACHQVEHTINDFRIAMQMVKKGGVIFIDDYNNPNWPGVQEGISKFYLMNSASFVPFLFTCNKLFICNISFHNQYLRRVTNFLKEHFDSSRVKSVKRFGYDTITVIPDLSKERYLASQ